VHVLKRVCISHRRTTVSSGMSCARLLGIDAEEGLQTLAASGTKLSCKHHTHETVKQRDILGVSISSGGVEIWDLKEPICSGGQLSRYGVGMEQSI
jgi:hypothetical protein